MKKRILGSASGVGSGSKEHRATALDDGWLELEHIAEVDISSEDPDHPIESALLPGCTDGWRAAGGGEQRIRLRFATPRALSRIFLRFVEVREERTQEYALSWSPDGRSFHELVRQRWNFSPNGSTSETEEHRVVLANVAVLDLLIVPDVSRGSAVASLLELRLA